MTNKIYEVKDNVEYIAPDGTIYTSREEYLDYMRGLRS